MENWKEIKPEELEKNPFHAIGKEWLLITAGNKEKSNTMTASWGAMGVMWGKPAVTVYIRPQRYTKEFVDAQGRFSVSILDESYRKALNLCGSVSGRNVEDKWAQAGLTAFQADGVPAVQEAGVILVCRTMYRDTIKPECFDDRSQEERWYPDKDYHTMYVAEVEKVLVRM